MHGMNLVMQRRLARDSHDARQLSAKATGERFIQGAIRGIGAPTMPGFNWINRLRPRHGLSIVELAMTMAIIGIMATIAAPRYANSLSRYRADLAAKRIETDLAYARNMARTTSASHCVVFDLVNNNYYLTADLNAKPVGVVDLGAEPYHGTLVAADFAGKPTIIFNGFGVANGSGKVEVRVGSELRTIEITAVNSVAITP